MPWSMIPLPTVVATLRWNTNTAITLKTAASSTAWWGFSTRVETTVAIEFAASWKPFMKSKASATSTSPITMLRLSWEASIRPSRVFQDDAFDDVGDVLAAVGDGLEEIVDHAQLHHLPLRGRRQHRR